MVQQVYKSDHKSQLDQQMKQKLRASQEFPSGNNITMETALDFGGQFFLTEIEMLFVVELNWMFEKIFGPSSSIFQTEHERWRFPGKGEYRFFRG